MCIEDLDKTVVSDVGVDDHSIKFPLADEPSVCACVNPRCLLTVLSELIEVSMPDNGLSYTDHVVGHVMKDGCESLSILIEHKPSASSVKNADKASIYIPTICETRGMSRDSDSVSSCAPTCISCKKTEVDFLYFKTT